jgi:hypothetical protein
MPRGSRRRHVQNADSESNSSELCVVSALSHVRPNILTSPAAEVEIERAVVTDNQSGVLVARKNLCVALDEELRAACRLPRPQPVRAIIEAVGFEMVLRVEQLSFGLQY